MTLSANFGSTAALTRWGATAALGAAAALHARWAAQTVNDTLPDDFAEVWIGEGAEVPPAWMTAGVAGVLTAMAGTVAMRHRLAWAVAAVLGLRGVGGLAASGLSSSDGPYRARDLTLYSPFCLTLAASIAISLRAVEAD